MKISLICSSDSEGPPLCRSYVTIFFTPITVHFRPIGCACAHAEPMLWALGVMADGLLDYLGSWHGQDPKDAWWDAIASNLHDRGVERLRIVVGPDPMQGVMTPLYRDCAALPASAPLSHLESESTLCGYRPYVERVLDAAHALSLQLKRAAARNGPFASAAAAATLLRQSADHYIYREWRERSESARAFHARCSMLLPSAVG